jgi:hypothetical protein
MAAVELAALPTMYTNIHLQNLLEAVRYLRGETLAQRPYSVEQAYS